jgi:transposase-like protein/IS1 family transposase
MFTCPLCVGPTRRFGRNRNGSQRYRCDACQRTFTDEASRPADGRRIDQATLVLCLRMLLEGNSVRSTERLTGVHRDTIIAAMVAAGEKCHYFLNSLRCIPASDVQADEIWSFVGCKERTRVRKNYPEIVGDAWTFTAIERNTKFILAWHLGKRSQESALLFAEQLRRVTNSRFQLSTDGFSCYPNVVRAAFGWSVDYAQLVKVYAKSTDDGPGQRYSPGEVISTYHVIQLGNPAEDRICTSHAERSNKTIRMQIRRSTRLTDGHSKKWHNHGSALALFFAYYNFCRVHSTLKTTPAKAAGLTERPWSVKELLAKAGAI